MTHQSQNGGDASLQKDPEDIPILAGELIKQTGKLSKKWEVRFVEISRQNITVKTPGTTDKPRIYSLENCEVNSVIESDFKHPHVFEILLPIKKKILVFQASSDLERADWVSTILYRNETALPFMHRPMSSSVSLRTLNDLGMIGAKIPAKVKSTRSEASKKPPFSTAFFSFYPVRDPLIQKLWEREPLPARSIQPNKAQGRIQQYLKQQQQQFPLRLLTGSEDAEEYMFDPGDDWNEPFQSLSSSHSLRTTMKPQHQMVSDSHILQIVMEENNLIDYDFERETTKAKKIGDFTTYCLLRCKQLIDDFYLTQNVQLFRQSCKADCPHSTTPAKEPNFISALQNQGRVPSTVVESNAIFRICVANADPFPVESSLCHRLFVLDQITPFEAEREMKGISLVAEAQSSAGIAESEFIHYPLCCTVTYLGLTVFAHSTLPLNSLTQTNLVFDVNQGIIQKSILGTLTTVAQHANLKMHSVFLHNNPSSAPVAIPLSKDFKVVRASDQMLYGFNFGALLPPFAEDPLLSFASQQKPPSSSSIQIRQLPSQLTPSLNALQPESPITRRLSLSPHLFPPLTFLSPELLLSLSEPVSPDVPPNPSFISMRLSLPKELRTTKSNVQHKHAELLPISPQRPETLTKDEKDNANQLVSVLHDSVQKTLTSFVRSIDMMHIWPLTNDDLVDEMANVGLPLIYLGRVAETTKLPHVRTMCEVEMVVRYSNALLNRIVLEERQDMLHPDQAVDQDLYKANQIPVNKYYLSRHRTQIYGGMAKEAFNETKGYLVIDPYQLIGPSFWQDRKTQPKTRDSIRHKMKEIYLDYLNLLVGFSEESNLFWDNVIKPGIRFYFNHKITSSFHRQHLYIEFQRVTGAFFTESERYPFFDVRNPQANDLPKLPETVNASLVYKPGEGPYTRPEQPSLDDPPPGWLMVGRSKQHPFVIDDLTSLKPRVQTPQYLQSSQKLRSAAMMLEKLGKQEEALFVFNHLFDLIRFSEGIQTRQAVLCLIDISKVFFRTGDYNSADSYLKVALGIHPFLYHAEVAKIYVSLIEVSFKLGKIEDALLYSSLALNAVHFHLGYDTPFLIDIHMTLARGFSSEGEHLKAERSLEQASELAFRLLSSNHPITTKCTLLLAKEKKMQGDFVEAESLLVRALTVCESMFTASSIEAAQIQFEMAEIQKEQKNYQKGIQFSEKALKTYVELLGPLDKLTLESVLQLSSFNLKLGIVSEAIRLNEQALTILRSMTVPLHSLEDTDSTDSKLSDFTPSPELIEQIQIITKQTLTLLFNAATPDRQEIIKAVCRVPQTSITEDMIETVIDRLDEWMPSQYLEFLFAQILENKNAAFLELACIYQLATGEDLFFTSS